MRRKTAAQKRSSALERKYLDRAVLRLTRTFCTTSWETKVSEQQLRELIGLVAARRRVP
jgi:hypothetical protein